MKTKQKIVFKNPDLSARVLLTSLAAVSTLNSISRRRFGPHVPSKIFSLDHFTTPAKFVKPVQLRPV